MSRPSTVSTRLLARSTVPHPPRIRALAVVAGLALGAQASAQVLDEARISNLAGGFSGVTGGSEFSRSLASLGDLDGSGALHLAVGAPYTGPLGMARGSVFVLRLDASRQVAGEVEITEGLGGFTGTLTSGGSFGYSVAAVGDLDADGVVDLAVGEPNADTVRVDSGTVWILRLNADGTVKATQELSLAAGGAPASLPVAGEFGHALAPVGDLDGDGVPDLAASQSGGDATAPAGVWILFLNADGTIKASTRFGAGTGGGFPGSDVTSFGHALANLGVRGPSGLQVLAIGDRANGGAGEGLVWLTALRADGTNTGVVRIGEGLGGFPGDLAPGDRFGDALAAFDADQDGVQDLVVGAPWDSRSESRSGAAWILTLDAAGQVTHADVVTEGEGGFGATLADDEWFGQALLGPGDLDGDGRDDLLVAAPRADEGDPNTGALWFLTMSCPGAAGVTLRNGSGLNALRLSALSDPVLGSTIDLAVDCSGHQPAFAAVVVYDEPFEGLFLAGGELLVDVTSPFGASTFRPHSGDLVVLSLDVPADPTLCGYTGSTQAVVLGPPGYELTNALDVVVGH